MGTEVRIGQVCHWSVCTGREDTPTQVVSPILSLGPVTGSRVNWGFQGRGTYSSVHLSPYLRGTSPWSPAHLRREDRLYQGPGLTPLLSPFKRETPGTPDPVDKYETQG